VSINTVAPTDDIDAEPMLTKADARSLTAEIRNNLQRDWDLICRAYVERAWQAMGYASWDAYCTTEFNSSLLRLPREDREATVVSLHDRGLSVRAIASATGMGKSTVQRELSPVPNGTPGGLTSQSPGQTPRVAEALAKARGADDLAHVVDLDEMRLPLEPERVPAAEKYAHIAAPADVIQVDPWDYDYHLRNDDDDATRFIFGRGWDELPFRYYELSIEGYQDQSGAIDWHADLDGTECHSPDKIRSLAQALLEAADELERRQGD
jgi:hypothetical protein